jgi:hypothetical protein
VERVRDISEADARAEGAEPVDVPECCGMPDRDARGDATCCGYPVPEPSYVQGFSDLWDSINKTRGFGWDVNPWVFVVGFEVAK